MTRTILWTLALVTLISGCAVIGALAQSPAMPYGYAVSVGTSSTTAVAANPARKYIQFCNPNDTAKVAVCPTVGRSGTITCTVNGAGSVTLLPYACQGFGGIGGTPSIPTGWNAISSAGGSALTVMEWE
jgi:hypothetical protein